MDTSTHALPTGEVLGGGTLLTRFTDAEVVGGTGRGGDTSSAMQGARGEGRHYMSDMGAGTAKPASVIEHLSRKKKKKKKNSASASVHMMCKKCSGQQRLQSNTRGAGPSAWPLEPQREAHAPGGGGGGGVGVSLLTVTASSSCAGGGGSGFTLWTWRSRVNHRKD